MELCFICCIETLDLALVITLGIVLVSHVYRCLVLIVILVVWLLRNLSVCHCIDWKLHVGLRKQQQLLW